MKKKERLNCWISPEGKVFKCDSHDKWAAQFLKEKWGEDWYEHVDVTRLNYTLEAWSWVRIVDKGDGDPEIRPRKDYFPALQKTAIIDVFQKHKKQLPEWVKISISLL